ILVNITAGPDLSLGEFAEVGDTIEEFSSDNATVVVGTVIDPDMGDEIRVTVVATGLGRPEEVRPTAVPARAAKVVQNNGDIDYGALERPTITRRPITEATARRLDLRQDADLDYLDIPAFLRRQAD
ncbi:MAG: cell division protein FtsZ, partial [Porticoccaceae bacterium]